MRLMGKESLLERTHIKMIAGVVQAHQPRGYIGLMFDSHVHFD